jgi:carbon monoxide dehydrogenase subunit G
VETDSSSGGMLARVGQRMTESFARSMMEKFFSCLQQTLK